MDKIRIFHFCIPIPAGNFGDDVIYFATRESISEALKGYRIEWVEYPLRNHTTDTVIKKANDCDAVLVGAGGLILKGRTPNLYSGWQWACSLKHLEMIKKPLIIYSIGYNKFRGQDDFDDIFFSHISSTIEKSSYFSVRNYGSKDALNFIGIKGNIRVSPCPTLFYNNQKVSNGFEIGINLAGDRSDLRFNRETFYASIVRIYKYFKSKGFLVSFINFNWNPDSNCFDLIESLGSNYIALDTMLNKKDVDESLLLLDRYRLVISMRSHAQIIPFGRGISVLSLISHDKLRWFLEDANMGETGIEVSSSNLYEKVIDISEKLLDGSFERAQIEATQRFRASHKAAQDEIRRCIIYG